MLVGSRRSVLVHVCSLLDHGQGQARCEEGCCPEGEEVGEEEREEDHEEEVSVQVIDTRVASGSACTAALYFCFLGHQVEQVGGAQCAR